MQIARSLKTSLALVSLLGASLAGASLAQAAGINGDNVKATQRSEAAPMAKPGKAKVFNAVVESTGVLVRGSATAVVKLANAGSFQVEFPIDVTNCSFHATLGTTDVGVELDGVATTARRAGVANGVFVKTFDTAGTQVDRPFHLAVICS